MENGRHPKLGDRIFRPVRIKRHHLRRVMGVPALFSIGYGDVGSSIYYGLGVVTLMYQAKILLESDPRTAMDTKHASEKYNAALQIRQLMDVRSGDIVMPDYVDDPVSGNKIPIATTSFIRGKLID